MGCSRFAPSATGPAHPGTLLAGLLCWLDARLRGDAVILRIENLDPQRCSPQKVDDMIAQLTWFGLDDWDAIQIQSQQRHRHQQALGQLLDSGLLYACHCSRRDIRAVAKPAVDGGWVYPGTCRSHHLATGSEALWSPDYAVRIQLEGFQAVADESGMDLSQNLCQDMGDPVIRRRDGAISYHLASVVDDLAAGVTRVVRGRDLAQSSALQARLRQLLGGEPVTYRHHLLIYEPQGNKMAKFHQAVGVPELSQFYSGPDLCGFLAWLCGLQDRPQACSPQDLLPIFDWNVLPQIDPVLRWDGNNLQVQTPHE